jgi:excisionase family DNA binding protein
MSTNIEISRICEFCKRVFTAKTTTTRFCSKPCNEKQNRKNYKAKIRDNKVVESNKETIAKFNLPLEHIKIKDFLSIADVTILLGISKSTFYRMVQQKKFVVTKIGERTIIRRTDLNLFFQQ